MSITLNQFVEKYRGKVCTHPKGIKGQCVCLIRCYLDDVLGVPQFNAVKSAKDIWYGVVLNSAHFIRIPNTFFTVPQNGDIFIIDAFPGNPNGHTGIVLSGSLWSFTSFDSNWSKKNIALVESHGYIRPRVLGFFRPRNFGGRPLLPRVNEALRARGDDPNRSVGTLTLSKWWQNRVVSDRDKFTDDEKGYTALVNAIKWHQDRKKYPHNI